MNIEIINHNEWFKLKVKDNLSSDSFNNLTMFPILWNIYENNFWSTNFKVNRLDDNISSNISRYLKDIRIILMIKNKIEDYRTERNFSLNHHYRSLSPTSFDLLDKFLKKSSSKSENDILWVLIWITYRVRCNMFHGVKKLFDFEEMESQSQLFEILNIFLIYLIDDLV